MSNTNFETTKKSVQHKNHVADFRKDLFLISVKITAKKVTRKRERIEQRCVTKQEHTSVFKRSQFFNSEF